MNSMKLRRPEDENAWPWWIIALSGGLVVLLGIALLAGANGACQGHRADACAPGQAFRTTACAHIAQSFAAVSGSAGLVYSATSSKTAARD